MENMKKVFLFLFLFYLALILAVVFNNSCGNTSPFCLLADKEEMYNLSEEFLPVYINETENKKSINDILLENENIIRNAKIEGIKFLKQEREIVFTIGASDPDDIEGKDIWYDVFSLNFPPRVIICLYGVSSNGSIVKFFKNMEITGFVLNPYVEHVVSEYVIFFKDLVAVNVNYDKDEKKLALEYYAISPEYTMGYGVRIADTQIDPIPQIIMIKKELTKYGLENYLLIASDHKTVVLESPFYKTKDEAAQYIDSLENFGYKGKLAIREYKDFPKPHRFEVVSEMIITGENGVNLESVVYNEFVPEKIYQLSYSEIHLITKDIFSPNVQRDENKIAKYYYKLSDMYKNYSTTDDSIKEMAFIVAIKLLEIIYFYYPKTANADESLWNIANMIRETGIKDFLNEITCYKKIISEYPDSLFAGESIGRVKVMENHDIYMLLRKKNLKDN